MRGALEDVHEIPGGVRKGDEIARRDPMRERQAPPGEQLALDAVGADQIPLGRLTVVGAAEQQGVDEEVV